MRIRKQIAASATLLVLLSASVQGGDIVDTAANAGSFNTLVAAVKAAGLVETLKGEGPFTVFAPTDEAFAHLPAGTVENLLKPENRDQLIGILTYHVVPGRVLAADVLKLSGATTVNGQRVDISTKDGVKVDTANVVKTDIECSNGVIHVIDSVILPAGDDLATTAVNAGSFGTLVAAAKAAGLVDALTGEGPLTVFAPTDEAFAQLPAGTVESLLQAENKDKLVAILKYHIVAGRVYSDAALEAGKATTLQGSSITISADSHGARVNDANLVNLDIDASNGVIHVIDSVLLPPEKQAAATPRRMIELAIHRGAPLYNAGHRKQCADIYMNTVEEILASDSHMPESVVQVLSRAARNVRHCNCSDTNAWTLRRAMDTAYAHMPVR